MQLSDATKEILTLNTKLDNYRSKVALVCDPQTQRELSELKPKTAAGLLKAFFEAESESGFHDIVKGV